jgi:hypothetical protein
MDEAYVCRRRTIIPLNEVDCTHDVETRPRNRSSTQCRVRVPQTCTQLNSVCLLFVNTGERVHLNNVKGHFGISMAKEIYGQSPVFTNW